MTNREDVRRAATAIAKKIFTQRNPAWGREVIEELFEHCNISMASSLNHTSVDTATKQLLTVAGTIIKTGQFDVNQHVEGEGEVKTDTSGNMDSLSPRDKMKLGNQLIRDKQIAEAAANGGVVCRQSDMPPGSETWSSAQCLTYAREWERERNTPDFSNKIIATPPGFDKLSPRQKLEFANRENQPKSDDV